MLAEARLRRSALLQIFARVFALAADEAFRALAELRTLFGLAALAQGRGVAALILARLAGRALSAGLTIFLVGLAAETRLLRAKVALLTERLLSLALLAKLLLGLLALFLLAALAGSLIVVLLSDRRLLSTAFVLITLSHADILS